MNILKSIQEIRKGVRSASDPSYLSVGDVNHCSATGKPLTVDVAGSGIQDLAPQSTNGSEIPPQKKYSLAEFLNAKNKLETSLVCVLCGGSNFWRSIYDRDLQTMKCLECFQPPASSLIATRLAVIRRPVDGSRGKGDWIVDWKHLRALSERGEAFTFESEPEQSSESTNPGWFEFKIGRFEISSRRPFDPSDPWQTSFVSFREDESLESGKNQNSRYTQNACRRCGSLEFDVIKVRPRYSRKDCKRCKRLFEILEWDGSG
jgi:hypothetical protein